MEKFLRFEFAKELKQKKLNFIYRDFTLKFE